MRIIVLVFLFILFLSGCSKRDCKKDPVNKILTERFSGYKYDPSKKVEPWKIKCLARAASLAPSSYNEQPWAFIICDKLTNPTDYNKALNTLLGSNQKWGGNAQLLIICMACTKTSRNTFNELAQFDAGAATFSLMLQANSLGLMAHHIGGFDKSKLKELFPSIPEEYKPMCLMAIGYGSKDEKKEKKRAPLNKKFFFGQWGINNEWKD